MKYYIIAGEASGDLHAANLVKAIRSIDPDAQLRGWGGDRMQAAGVEIVKHYRETAFMGFFEVIRHLPQILRLIRFCKKDLVGYAPDKVILVDYPGFNLRIATFAKSRQLPVYYYISPQVWAWKASRVKKIRRDVRRMLVILPFEQEFYSKYNYHVDFVGHPLLDALAHEKSTEPSDVYRSRLSLDGRPIVALLPGSRKQEVQRMLPVMLEAARKTPGYQFVIGKAPSLDDDFYQQVCGVHSPVLAPDTHELLRHSAAALVTSGTATLETALLGIPQVVCYKGATLSYLIAKQGGYEDERR